MRGSSWWLAMATVLMFLQHRVVVGDRRGGGSSTLPKPLLGIGVLEYPGQRLGLTYSVAKFYNLCVR